VTSEANLDKLRNGWFSEVNEQWPGIALSLEVDSVLMEKKSQYQVNTRSLAHARQPRTAALSLPLSSLLSSVSTS
jgi:hypothetical protein